MAIISLTSSGIKDFFIQRFTAIIIALYFSYLITKIIILSHAGNLNYYTWKYLFTHGIFFRIFTLITYLSIFFHAWIGIWNICSDYIKCTWLYIFIMISFILIYLFCFFWLFIILFNC